MDEYRPRFDEHKFLGVPDHAISGIVRAAMFQFERDASLAASGHRASAGAARSREDGRRAQERRTILSKFTGGLLAVAVMAGALALAPEADAGYRLGFVSYKIEPSVVDGWTMDADADTDAAEKAAAKALRFERLAACGAHLLDQNNDGTPTAVGASSCEGAGGQHIRYNGDSRANHPGSAGSAWPSDTRDEAEQSSFSAWQDCDIATYSQGDGTNSADLFCVIDSGVGTGELRFVNDAARTAYHSR